LRRSVEAVQDPGVAMMKPYVTIRLAGGRRVEKHVPSALGSIERPMSDHDLEAKFHALVENVLPTQRADQLIAAYLGAEQCEDASSISRSCGAVQPT
jgi:2-methylcitrate dehydratase PrpD